MNSKLFNGLLHPAYYNFILDILIDVLDLLLVWIDVFFSSQDMVSFQICFLTVSWNTHSFILIMKMEKSPQ